MNTKEEARFFKIGLFIIVALSLFVLAVVVFVGSNLFTKEVDFETYFNESVQGLNVGSEVKFRGITIGEVKKISFTGNEYHATTSPDPSNRYVYVLFTVNPEFIAQLPTAQHLRQFIASQVKNGLRAKLAMKSLTGGAYLELNFTNPAQNPVLPIHWTPNHIYIPSTTSVFTQFTDNIQSVLNGLKRVDFETFFNNIQDLAQTTNESMQNVNYILTSSESSLIDTMKNMEDITNSLRGMAADLKANPSSLLFDKPQVVNPAAL